MAMARVTCKCAACGAEFEISKQCHNRAEADNYEAWALKAFTECKDCHRVRNTAESGTGRIAAFKAEHKLPEIHGVSDKQIKFASDLRDQFISRVISYHEEEKVADAETLIATPAADWVQWAKDAEMPLDEYRKSVIEYYGIGKIITILTTGEARAIIDALK